MPPRTSNRSSVTRDQASSPPKQTNMRQSQSPVGRRTRSTRSASAELGDNDTGVSSRRGGKRGVRQTSVESVESDTSAGSSDRGGRRRKATHAAAAARDLSMVAEDRENEEMADEGDADLDQGTGRAQRSQSPGGMSQMSGTTAITSFTAMTTHSAAEVANLDPMMAETLPELLRCSVAIIDLLALPNATEDTVESIARELKVFGSRRAKRLKYDEDKFKVTRDNYGSDEYITPSWILRKLFGSEDPDSGSFRPDSILHSANLATMVKDLLVTQKASRGTQHILAFLDTMFPEIFVSSFESEVQFGSSILVQESFSIALDIRTQYVIVALAVLKGESNWDPEQILTTAFYEGPPHRDPELSEIEDTITNGRLKDIMRAGPSNSEDQVAMIMERFQSIHSAFRQSNDAAIEAGDLVDFEHLDELFPWLTFLANVVRWTRSRLTEIGRSIKQQGGVDNITKSLVEVMRSIDSQIEVMYDPPSFIMESRQLLPAANIVQGASGQSLYDGKSTVRALEKLKRGNSSTERPPSNQNQKRAASTVMASSSQSNVLPGPSKLSISQPIGSLEIAEAQGYKAPDDFRPVIDDDEGNDRPTTQYLALWNAHSNDKNKENRPIPEQAKASAGKRSLLHRQPNAEKVQWEDNSQDSVAGPSNRKRARRDREETEESEDQGFQHDQRVPDPSRRTAAPPARRRTPVQATPSPPKRARVQSSNDSLFVERDDGRSSQDRAEAALQASARLGAFDDDDDDEDEDDRPRFTQVSQAAHLASVRLKVMNEAPPQKRTAWSEPDTHRLINLIGDYGCRWSVIGKQGGFEVERGQVALKDKARNIKVSFLKAGMRLPPNFDNVPLGKKELESVRSVAPEYL